jgi:hypothetical protein
MSSAQKVKCVVVGDGAVGNLKLKLLGWKNL